MDNMIIKSSLIKGSNTYETLAPKIKEELEGRKFDNMLPGVMNRISEEYVQATVKLHEAKLEIEELKAQNKEAKLEIEKLKAQNKEAKREIEELKAQNKEAKLEIEKLKAQNKTLSTLIKIGLIAIVVIGAIGYIFLKPQTILNQ